MSNRILICCFAFLASLFSVTAAAEAENDSLAADAPRDGYRTRMAVSLKIADLAMEKRDQVLKGNEQHFSDRAHGEFAVEVESKLSLDSGLTLGGEAFRYSNDFKCPNLHQYSSWDQCSMEVVGVLFKAKYFVPVSKSFQPFVGAGIGYVEAFDDSGPIAGGANGTGTQFVAGVQWRGKRVGTRLEYSVLRANLEDRDEQKVDASARGFRLALTFHFLQR